MASGGNGGSCCFLMGALFAARSRNPRLEQRADAEVGVVAAYTVLDPVSAVGLLAEILGFIVALDARVEHVCNEQGTMRAAMRVVALHALTGGDREVADAV